MKESKAVLAYPRLMIAYFCQFAIWGAWAATLGGYAGGTLKFSGWEIGWLYSVIPLGAVIAPLFIGPLADRFFSAQKVMSCLHLIGGLALIGCWALCWAQLESLFLPLTGLMFLSGICYMPTIGLLNSVVFKHVSKAPYVFVFGTIGWLIVNLVVACFCGGAGSPLFFLVGGGVGVFLALYSLTLPNTPPKGAAAPGEKSSGGLGVLSLFKNVQFSIFVVCVFFASIPCNQFFFPSIITFLTERGYPSPVALNSLCQVSELFLMLALAFCVPRIGLKNVLLIGMSAWWLRYLCFASPYFDFQCTLAGLLLHGFCFAFLYVASNMYADKIAPAHLKASAQSMMVFLLLGVSQVCGSFTYGTMSEIYAPKHSAIAVDKSLLTVTEGKVPNVGFTTNVPIPAWKDSADSAFRYFDFVAQVNGLLGVKEPESKDRSIDLGKLLESKLQKKQAVAKLKELEGKSLTAEAIDELKKLDGKPMTTQAIAILEELEGKPLTAQAIAELKKLDTEPLTPATIAALKESDLIQDKVKVSDLTIDGIKFQYVDAKDAITADVQYTQADLAKLAKEIAGKDDFELTRKDWLAAQAKDWTKIYGIPAIFIIVFFVIFAIFGREPKGQVA